eukprot:NODE_278_length_2326_cov_10.079930_g217_i0.p1 GENE.NODE_278_length_2326_cov_10.079930_g217_i0~~NODE_278_length_2326_cov_10.079930_g217_i0.p1  ORF type:complete len:502 (-),score=73.30 NODE_278_length_2326_cov_10.079930_g217_i0:752-2257(-)
MLDHSASPGGRVMTAPITRAIITSMSHPSRRTKMGNEGADEAVSTYTLGSWPSYGIGAGDGPLAYDPLRVGFWWAVGPANTEVYFSGLKNWNTQFAFTAPGALSGLAVSPEGWVYALAPSGAVHSFQPATTTFTVDHHAPTAGPLQSMASNLLFAGGSPSGGTEVLYYLSGPRNDTRIVKLTGGVLAWVRPLQLPATLHAPEVEHLVWAPSTGRLSAFVKDASEYYFEQLSTSASPITFESRHPIEGTPPVPRLKNFEIHGSPAFSPTTGWVDFVARLTHVKCTTLQPPSSTCTAYSLEDCGTAVDDGCNMFAVSWHPARGHHVSYRMDPLFACPKGSPANLRYVAPTVLAKLTQPSWIEFCYPQAVDQPLTFGNDSYVIATQGMNVMWAHSETCSGSCNNETIYAAPGAGHNLLSGSGFQPILPQHAFVDPDYFSPSGLTLQGRGIQLTAPSAIPTPFEHRYQVAVLRSTGATCLLSSFYCLSCSSIPLGPGPPPTITAI